MRDADGWERNQFTVMWDVRLLPGYAWLDPDRNPFPRFHLFPRLCHLVRRVRR